MIDSHDYHVQLTGMTDKEAVVEAVADGLPPLPVASPPEFGGPGGLWSPEHLFVAALSACLMTTFRAIAEMSRLEVLAYEDHAEGHLARGEDRRYRFERVTLRPRVTVLSPGDVERAHRLLDKAEAACLISRSVSSEVTMEPDVVVAQPEGVRG